MRRIDLHCYPGTPEWIASQGPFVEALGKYWNKPWVGRSESEVYEGARHGWTVPDSPVFNGPQAERAFAKLTGLFAQALRSA